MLTKTKQTVEDMALVVVRVSLICARRKDGVTHDHSKEDADSRQRKAAVAKILKGQQGDCLKHPITDFKTVSKQNYFS